MIMGQIEVYKEFHSTMEQGLGLGGPRLETKVKVTQPSTEKWPIPYMIKDT